MKAVLKLEHIGDNYRAWKRAGCTPARYGQRYERIMGRDTSRPWVALITGVCQTYGYQRQFIDGQKDYSLANGEGSRGVFVYYPLASGCYEVNERLTWKKTRRYFIMVKDCEITEIDQAEVDEWLKSII